MQHRCAAPPLSVEVELTSAHFPNYAYLTGPTLQGLQEARGQRERESLSHTHTLHFTVSLQGINDVCLIIG